MKKTALLLLVVLTSVVSCKKKDKEELLEETTPQQFRNIAVSDQDPSVTVVDITPDSVLAPSPSMYHDMGFLVDLNSDGTPDFKLNLTAEIIFAHTYFSNGSLTIETLNNNSFISSDSIYDKSVFNGNDSLLSKSSVNAIFPKVLSVNDSIKESDKWRSGKLTLLNTEYTYLFSPTATSPTITAKTYAGAWLNKDEKYIGLRYQNISGWIKIGINGYSTIKIYKYAASK